MIIHIKVVTLLYTIKCQYYFIAIFILNIDTNLKSEIFYNINKKNNYLIKNNLVF